MIRTRDFVASEMGEGLAVAHRSTNRIILLNASASVAWLVLTEEGRTTAALARDMHSVLSSAFAPFEHELEPLLVNWRELGLVDCDGNGIWSIKNVSQDPSVVGTHLGSDFCADLPQSDIGLIWRRCVELSGSIVVMEIRGAQTNLFNENILRMVAFLDGLPKSAAIGGDRTISLNCHPEGMSVISVGHYIELDDLAKASSVYNLMAIKQGYLDYLAPTIIHAAAVCCPSGAVILPAISGSGKSTLAAYLIARGWNYGGDDIVGLGRSPLSGDIRILPFPTALGIKEGSIQVLKSDYPELVDAPVIRYGNKTVRFINIGSELLPPEDGLWRSPRAFVFPSYHPQSVCELIPLSEWDALALLLEAGTGIGTGTDLDSFELLTNLIKTVPRFRLSYSNLSEAAFQLELLLLDRVEFDC